LRGEIKAVVIREIRKRAGSEKERKVRGRRKNLV